MRKFYLSTALAGSAPYNLARYMANEFKDKRRKKDTGGVVIKPGKNALQVM